MKATATESPSSWAIEQVNIAILRGLVPSSLQSNYTQSITRSEFCALVVTLFEYLKGDILGRTTFIDTNDINVEKAAYIGIITGIGNNKFDPAGSLTREQAAVMISRLTESIGYPLPAHIVTFVDNDNIASWAVDSVGKVQSAGIMSGVGENRFAPQQSYTREQSIVTIMRVLHITESKTSEFPAIETITLNRATGRVGRASPAPTYPPIIRPSPIFRALSDEQLQTILPNLGFHALATARYSGIDGSFAVLEVRETLPSGEIAMYGISPFTTIYVSQGNKPLLFSHEYGYSFDRFSLNDRPVTSYIHGTPVIAILLDFERVELPALYYATFKLDDIIYVLELSDSTIDDGGLNRLTEIISTIIKNGGANLNTLSVYIAS